MLDLIESFINFLFGHLPQKQVNADQLALTKIVAHRGCHETDMIENTLPAFNWCVENSVWAIEFDIRFTADNVPVIHHDASCGRYFKRADLVIEDLKFEELRMQIPEMPSFQEVIEECSHKIHFMIEIKTKLTTVQNNILDELLSDLEPGQDFHLIALESTILDSIHFVSSRYFIPITILKTKELMNYALKNQCAGLAGYFLFINRSIQRKLSQHGIRTGVGYIASKNSLRREINRGHEWLFTDRAQSAINWLNELKKD